MTDIVTGDDSYGVTVRCLIPTGKIFGKVHPWGGGGRGGGGILDTKWNVPFPLLSAN